jgi:hypothetical protein
MKHTQGKWEISNLGNLYGFKDCIVSEVKDKTYPKYTDSPTKINVIATMQYWNKDENKANANLIASAPEMLEVLNYIVDECEKMKVAEYGANGIYDDTPIHQIRETLYRVLRLFNKKAKAVTTKAEGKQ